MRAVRRRRRPRQGPPTVVERWKFERGRGPGILHLATRVEAGLHRGQVAGRAAVRLKVKAFTPDLIIAHAGWGETMSLKERSQRAQGRFSGLALRCDKMSELTLFGRKMTHLFSRYSSRKLSEKMGFI